MSSEAEDELKKRFSQLIEHSILKSEEVELRAGDLAKHGRYARDLGLTARERLKYATASSVDWRRMIGTLQYSNEQQDQILSGLPTFIGTATSASTAAASSMTGLADYEAVCTYAPRQEWEQARRAAEELSAVIDKFAEKEEVKKLLRQFGLDNATAGEKSPLELFETAHAAFDKPVIEGSPVVTSLLPMRECINGIVAALLRLRPRQEPARNEKDKVVSVWKQCAVSGVSQTAIDALAQQWYDLHNELSDFKQKGCSRTEWRDLLRKTTLLLVGLLRILDPARLRQVRG
ncbi:MAG: hypothetical protein Q7O66_03955 [Dehalococcoidia bacterium]|nr:hypothetical protein [Dehalococcoidia bacterium]